jgi:hypothetical protein
MLLLISEKPGSGPTVTVDMSISIILKTYPTVHDVGVHVMGVHDAVMWSVVMHSLNLSSVDIHKK